MAKVEPVFYILIKPEPCQRPLQERGSGGPSQAYPGALEPGELQTSIRQATMGRGGGAGCLNIVYFARMKLGGFWVFFWHFGSAGVGVVVIGL